MGHRMFSRFSLLLGLAGLILLACTLPTTVTRGPTVVITAPLASPVSLRPADIEATKSAEATALGRPAPTSPWSTPLRPADIEATKSAEATAPGRPAPTSPWSTPLRPADIEATKNAEATALARSAPTPPSQVPTQPQPIPTAPLTASSQAVCLDETCMGDGVRLSYLIVTRPLFIEALTPFVNWKTTQGYRVGVVTVDWLNTRFAGRHLAERMKTGMHTLRRATGLRYVLLVGDTEVRIGDFSVRNVLQSYDLPAPWNVPTGFYTRKDSSRDEATVTDTYFVEDRDWDPQNTGRNPLPLQETNVLGEGRFEAAFFLGRWTVRRPAEIAPIMAKTQAVAPVSQILFTSDRTLSNGAPLGDWCLREPPPSASNPRAPCYGDAMGTVRLRLFESHAPWLRTESLFVDMNDPSQVDQLFNRFATFDGVIVGLYHGAYNCWVSGRLCPMMQTNDRTIRTFSNFHLSNSPLLVADGCYIAAFYAGAEDTVFESLLKAASGPATIAQAPNNYMFLSALRDGAPVGDAFWQSGACYFIWGNPIHLLGDPSVRALRGPGGQ